MLIIYYENIESTNELKEIDIKNHTCYYLDDIIKIEDFDINNILIDEKPYKYMLLYNICYKRSKPLRIKFKKYRWIY